MSVGVLDHRRRATEFYMDETDHRYLWVQCTLYELNKSVILDAYGLFENCYCDGTWDSHFQSVKKYDDEFPGWLH